MDKKDNRRAVLVGLFLGLGLLVFIVGIFTLGGQQKTFSKSLHISSTFDDVEGLKAGNNVWFSGVKIGTISSIRFSGPAQVDVKMRIDAATQQYIHRNASARISSDGLIGNKIIVIDGGSPQAPIVQDGDVLQAAKLITTDDLLKTLQQNNQNLLSITGDFKLLGHKILQGKGTVGALMADSIMAIQLRNAMSNLAATTKSTARMAAQLEVFGQKVNTKGGLADKIFTDTVTFSKLKAAVNQLQAVTTNAQKMSENLKVASDKLNRSDNALGILINDPKAAAQMQSTLNNIQKGSVLLDEDLEALQHNFFTKGFFKDKAKAKADSLKKAGNK